MYSSERYAQAKPGPLHYAVLTRDCENVRKLLQRGTDVTAKNRDGDTALHMLRHPRKRISSRDAALTVEKWDEECIKLEKDIIRQLSSADKRCFHAQDAAGNTPLMSCIKARESINDFNVIMALMEREFEDSMHKNQLDPKVDFDILNNENESALDLAFANGRSDILKVICVYHFRKSHAVSVI